MGADLPMFGPWQPKDFATVGSQLDEAMHGRCRACGGTRARGRGRGRDSRATMRLAPGVLAGNNEVAEGVAHELPPDAPDDA